MSRDHTQLIERLRRVAVEVSEWDPEINAPYNDWADLMDEAARALEMRE